MTISCLLMPSFHLNSKAERIGKEDHRKWLGKDNQHGKSNWWMPIKWSISIVRKAMKDKRMANAPIYSSLVKAIAEFRKSLTEVVTYGHVTVPLVYTQVSFPTIFFWIHSFHYRWSILLFISTLRLLLLDVNQ